MKLEPVHTSNAAELHEQHAVLLFSDDRNESTKYVNEALRRGQLTVYASVNTSNNSSNDASQHISEIDSEFINYEDNVNSGNLLTLDTKSFYNSALAGNTEPFEELKMLIEEAIKERIASGKNDEGVTFVSGIAGMLATNEKIDESIDAEKWWEKTHSEWRQKGLKVTMICSHPSKIFDQSSHQQFMNYKQAMSSLHQIVVQPSQT
jgi:hypothetical protein